MPVRLLTIASLGTIVCNVLPGSAAQFQPDRHTLFLAHFNDNTHQADYAIGWARFAGNGARLTAGYYGTGIDLRARGVTKDFMTRCADYTPRYDGWGFHPRGNVDYWQGTFECWVRIKETSARSIAAFLSAPLARNVKYKDYYSGLQIYLTKYDIRWLLPLVDGTCFQGKVTFKALPEMARYLSPNDWHHFALCWSPGEMALYLDGRPVMSEDMTGHKGFAFVSNPVRFVQMGDCILDELRISNVVRYANDFEPAWRDGKRPAYAFPGVSGVKRHPAKLEPRPAPALTRLPMSAGVARWRRGDFDILFDRASGSLIGINRGVLGRSPAPYRHGLLLYEGLQRKPLEPRGLKLQLGASSAQVTQDFQGQVTARHDLTAGERSLEWRVTLQNRTQREIWLEALLGLPAPFRDITEIFDGSNIKTRIELPRRRDLYKSTLPFVAAAGKQHYVGLGIDPHIALSALVSEWIPDGGAGVLRQGTKIALSPGETFTLTWRILQGRGDFGALDAISAFHDLFPDLYHLRSEVPIYSYMPATQHMAADIYPDMKRVGYAGGEWGHGPSHDKGDEYATDAWWDNPKFYADKHYSGYARRLQKMWKSPENLRRIIPLFYQQSFDNWYPVRRFHTCPDLTPNWIIHQLMPDYTPNEDPLCMGQYYQPIWQASIVNEYHNPLGDHFKEHTRLYWNKMKSYSPGFINDFSHAGSLYRHNDPWAKRTPGRAFSRDLGTYIVKALGRQDRYELINGFETRGKLATIWSDGGSFSYSLCAYSSAIAIEGSAIYRDLVGPGEYTHAARYLLGEKPLTAMTSLGDDNLGYYLKPDMFTPESLRDYYRFCAAQLMLYCIRNGITMDPTSYLWGHQVAWEWNPLLVESAVRGRQIVPAARVHPPLWVRRSGTGTDTLLVIGNHQPRPLLTDLEVTNRYFGGAPLLGGYFGGKVRLSLGTEVTHAPDLTVGARNLLAFKLLGILQPAVDGALTTSFSGDGLAMRVRIEGSLEEAAKLKLNAFSPLYAVTGVQLNGKSIPLRDAAPALPLSAGKTTVVVEYRNRILQFTADDWSQVDLIRDGRTNFCLLARDPGRVTVGGSVFRLDFEYGTAAMLADFITQYDEEDGELGNLQRPQFVNDTPPGYSGWTVALETARDAGWGRVTIDRAARMVRIEGKTQGAVRRAMVVFLRLVDRKYPHVGRLLPLRQIKANASYVKGKPIPYDLWLARKPTQDFFAGFHADPLFIAKPVLNSEYEPLYADGNMNFAGKYRLQTAPYLFEPTCGEDYVYGYAED